MSQVLAQLGPQLAKAAALPAEQGGDGGRRGGLRSWTPEQALAEGVPPHHVPRSVRCCLVDTLCFAGNGNVTSKPCGGFRNRQHAQFIYVETPVVMLTRR